MSMSLRINENRSVFLYFKVHQAGKIMILCFNWAQIEAAAMTLMKILKVTTAYTLS